MDEHLQREILNRLDRDDSVKDPIANLIVSALRGEVEACLAGKPPSRIAPSQEQAAEPVRAYVESITVEGFRGIGPMARLS
ncbi:MAG TPA: hypothetical protein VMT78_08425, partial [Terriglobia bacterium]|nr:hypothetical protein [Terriglobia bacterium]